MRLVRFLSLLALVLVTGCPIFGGAIPCFSDLDCPVEFDCSVGNEVCVRRAPVLPDAGAPDAGADAGLPPEDGGDPGVDAGFDAGFDAGPFDAGPPICLEVVEVALSCTPIGVDGGPLDAGVDGGPVEAGVDAGGDAGALADAGLTPPALVRIETPAGLSISVDGLDCPSPGCVCLATAGSELSIELATLPQDLFVQGIGPFSVPCEGGTLVVDTRAVVPASAADVGSNAIEESLGVTATSAGEPRHLVNFNGVVQLDDGTVSTTIDSGVGGSHFAIFAFDEAGSFNPSVSPIVPSARNIRRRGEIVAVGDEVVAVFNANPGLDLGPGCPLTLPAATDPVVTARFSAAGLCVWARFDAPVAGGGNRLDLVAAERSGANLALAYDAAGALAAPLNALGEGLIVELIDLDTGAFVVADNALGAEFAVDQGVSLAARPGTGVGVCASLDTSNLVVLELDDALTEVSRLSPQLGGNSSATCGGLVFRGPDVIVGGTYQNQVVFGAAALPQPTAGDDAFIVRVSRDGASQIWQQVASGPALQAVRGLVERGDGLGVAIETRSNGPIQFGAAQLTPVNVNADVILGELNIGDGQVRWTTIFGGVSDDVIADLSATGDDLLVAGNTQSETVGIPPIGGGIFPDAFLVRFGF